MPSATKAATLTPDAELTYYSFPVTKTEETPEGDLIVWGKATDGTLDSDLQIVDPEWSGNALQQWLKSGGNVRVQHQAQRDPAGKGLEVEITPDGHFVKSLIVEPVAKKLVKAGVLQDYSVGIMNPDIRRGDPQFSHLDPAGKAVNGVITGRNDGMSRIGELSLVDRGSNFGTRFQLVKAAADGTAMLAGELTAPEDVLAKVAEPEKAKTVTVELPKNMSLSVKPSDLAKLATMRQKLAREEAAVKAAVTGEHGPETVHFPSSAKTAEPDAIKRDFDPNVGAHGTDRDKIPDEDFAGRGRSFPVTSPGDVTDALQSIGRAGEGNYDAKTLRSNILRIARRKGFPVPRADRKASKKAVRKVVKAAKSADPQVTKCGACGGSGMADGKPCTECKKGKKKSRRMEKRAVRKAITAGYGDTITKKKRVLCGSCGARQSRKHDNCSECGKPLAGAMGLGKNHDYTCLNCGKSLDKGEKHCPGCGSENPGYLPEADHKIPSNKAAKPPKERVRKKGRKARKGKGDSFGGKQAPPFGKGRRPDAGVTGSRDTKGLPAHREPDGPPIEMLERSASLEDGDEHQEMAAAARHKSLEARGLRRDDAMLHDLTCPAFSPADVRKCFPYASLAHTDAPDWQHRALKTAAAAPLEDALRARDLAGYAAVLKATDPALLADLREQAHAAFLAANKDRLKALTDATPGPGHAPTPAGHITPGQFRRPYISEGHAAESPQAGPPRSFPEPTEAPGAEHFTRPLITEGHAADAPQNTTPRAEHISPPAMTGRPQRVYYTGAMRDNARQAMSAMHDHIAHVFPDVCPMSPQLQDIQKPAPEVPNGVGGPVPHKGGMKAARKARKKLAARRRRYERRILKGQMSVEQARKKLGLKPRTRKGKPDVIGKVAAQPVTPAQVDADVIKSAVAEATAPLFERIAAQDKTLRKQRKAIDAIASQPDTTGAPNRGAVTKTSAAPAAPLTASHAAEQVQMAEIQRLRQVSLNSPDPAAREAARRDLDRKLGLSTMTPQT